MFQVKKVLNNNALLVINQENNSETILLGKGIGFHCKVDEVLMDIGDAKVYTLKEEIKTSINEVDPIYLDIASSILDEVLKLNPDANQTALLALADHIAFAIDRMKKGIDILNPFSKDISLLFPNEHYLALNSRDLIYNKTGYRFNDDEISYITLHIHSALDKNSVAESMKNTIIINETMSMIEELYHIHLNKDCLSYSRMLIHLKYMFARLKKNEHLKLDMDEYVSTNFTQSYQIAKAICHSIEEKASLKIPYTEIGYLAIHLERIRSTT